MTVVDIRKAHVIRIRNDHSGSTIQLADGTLPNQVASSDDIWLDVLRIDQFSQSNPHATSSQTQTVVYCFKWLDGPTDRIPSNDGRKRKTIKITNPNDDSQWVKLDIIEQMNITLPNATNSRTQAVVHRFANGSDNTVRQADVATVYNVDISPLDMTSTHYPVKWADYQQALVNGAQDKSQSLKVEIAKQFRVSNPNATNSRTQAVVWRMKNNDVKGAINQQIVSP